MLSRFLCFCFRVFEAERQQQANATEYKGGRATAADFNHFWTINEINNYETYLAAYHSDIVSTEVVGYSYEGRLLRAVKISQVGRGNVDGSRPIVFIDAGVHAREWAAHMFAMYLLHEIVELRAMGPLLQNFDIIILPVVNPDGYVFTHTNVSVFFFWVFLRESGI